MIIYKTTNLINGKIYIGKDSKNNPNYLGSGTILLLSIKKYGKKNFKKEIIEECKSVEELNEKEIYWIDKLKSRDKDVGYNIQKGGEGGIIWIGEKIFTEEHKKKISESCKGKIFTEEHKNNISKNHHNVSGENNPMYGKNHTEEMKENLRKINLGKKASDDTKKKLSERIVGELNHKSKLNREQVLEIRKIYKDGNKTQNEIAILFNVESPCIYKIVHYRTWKHIMFIAIFLNYF